jgi:polar amino acid transport system permease protein
LAPLRIVTAFYIQVIRGTPLLLQLFFIYYVLPYQGIVLSPFVSAVIGLTANYAAYMAEIFRSGIQAIPKGQWEAGAATGMSKRLLMRRIILPQALRIIIPSLGNNFVSIFKDSALVSVITMRDLMFSGQLLASATFKHFEIYAMVAAIYLAISYPAAMLVEWIERKLEIGRRPGVEQDQPKVRRRLLRIWRPARV